MSGVLPLEDEKLEVWLYGSFTWELTHGELVRRVWSEGFRLASETKGSGPGDLSALSFCTPLPLHP